MSTAPRVQVRKLAVNIARLAEQIEREAAALPRDKTVELDLVGVTEAAEMLDIQPATLSAYRSRGRFPEPIVTLTCGPIWHREDVAVYKAGIRSRENGS